LFVSFERFSSLFGSGPKETPTPKRSITTTTLSNTSTVKRSTTADQISPTTSKQQEQINEELLSSTLTATSNERFDQRIYSNVFQFLF